MIIRPKLLFLFISVSFPLNFPPLLVLSISAHDLAGAASCATSYVFTLLASLLAFFLLNISPHIILHFLYNNLLPLIFSLCIISWLKNTKPVFDFFSFSFFFSFLEGPHQLQFLQICHKVHFGNWSGLKEKESSSSSKHLDNCRLQHEKQLEVSGSWERREAACAVGQRLVECKKREDTRKRWRGKLGFWGWKSNVANAAHRMEEEKKRDGRKQKEWV